VSEAVYSFTSARREVLRRLGGRTDAASVDRVGAYLNSAMLRLAKSWLELPLLEENFTLTTVSGQSEYSINESEVSPRDVLGIRCVTNVTSGWLMSRFPWREYRAIASQSSGPPIRWARHGNVLAVDSEPDGVYELLIDYRQRPTSDSLDEFDSDWHETIVDIATHLGWTAFQQPQLAGAALGPVPSNVREAISRPMEEMDFEAFWDDELGFRPMGW
jgi:hypothetical protein